MFKESYVKFGMTSMKFHGVSIDRSVPPAHAGAWIMKYNSTKFQAGHAKFYSWLFEHVYIMSVSDLMAF